MWKLIRMMCLLAVWLASPALVTACLLCTSQGQPLVKEISEAKLVVFGKVTEAHLGADGVRGTSDFAVETILHGERQFIKNSKLVLPRYVPPVPCVKYVIFLDVIQGQVDPYRSIVCNSDRLVKYIQNMPPITGEGTATERQARLKYVFDFFQDAEPELAADAYKVWSVASNQDVAIVASQLDAEKLYRWLLDPKTPTYCLSLFSYLLGASGKETHAAQLEKMLASSADSRYATAIDGILAGIYRQDQARAWKQATKVIAETTRPFSERYAVLKFLRFQFAVGMTGDKAAVTACIDKMLDQPDMVDIAIEQLRAWKIWDQQERIFKLYTSRTSVAPITKHAIVKYAIACDSSAARQLIAIVTQREPDLIQDVRESLELLGKP